MFIKGINKMDTKICYPFYKGRTAFEVPVEQQIELAIDRQINLDHSQSINIFLSDRKYKQGVESAKERITLLRKKPRTESVQEELLGWEKIIEDLLKDADVNISKQQAQAFLQAWRGGLYSLYYLRLEDTRHVTACESCAG
jgi:ribonucleotide reductase alpha subunit